jgi:hypothetical protein
MPPDESSGHRIPIPDQVEYMADDPGMAPAAPTWEDVESRLCAERDFWLVALRPDGRPHAVVVWGIWESGCLWFTMSPRTWTARHLSADPRVLAHLPSGRDAVVIEGEARRPAVDSVPAVVVDRYEQTFGWRLDPADPNMPYFALQAASVRAWFAADVRGTATRWEFGSPTGAAG